MANSKRDELRGKIFSSKNKQFKTEECEIYGCKVEIRQPSLGMILAAQEGDDRAKAVVMLLVGYCYVPGTEEKVFEEGDVENLLSMPFGDDLIKVNQVIEKLTNIDVLSAEKNSEKAQGEETS